MNKVEVITHHARTGETLYDVPIRTEKGLVIFKFRADRPQFEYLGAYREIVRKGDVMGHEPIPRNQRGGLTRERERAREAAGREFYARHPWLLICRRFSACELGPGHVVCLADDHRLLLPVALTGEAEVQP